LDENRYRKLVAGDIDGFGAKLLRAFLKLASYPYAAAIGARNFCYDKGLVKSSGAPVPVISIGNLTVGGTGKTPLTIWLCNKLAEKRLKVAVLTRGYKMGKQWLSDEPAEINKNCRGVKVIVNPDRVAGATTAIRKYGAQILIMDDGFAHRRLRRDLDIIVVDATCPFGFGELLPAGLLREPLTALKRADAAILTRCDLVKEGELTQIEDRLCAFNPQLTIARTMHSPAAVRMSGAEDSEPAGLTGRQIFAFCGIGNPDAFFRQLANLKLNIAAQRIYNDHHSYSSDDIADIYEEAKYLGANLILTTQKDWIKAAPLAPEYEIPLAYLAVKLEFLGGEDKILGLIGKTLKEA
jgi:tetraacyldisaccharide 4'-kinase